MKKLIISLIVCAALLIGAASAEGIPRAALPYDITVLERHEGFSVSSEGEWYAQDHALSAILDCVAAGEINASLTKGAAIFGLTLSGNVQTGSLRPEITLYMVAREPLDVKAVTFIADSVSYDIAAVSERTAIGTAPAEKCRLPVTQELLPLLRSISAGSDVRVIVMGTQGVYDSSLTASSSTLESASLRCFSLMDILSGELGIDSYGLWDISADEWMSLYSLEPLSHISDDDKTSLIKPGDRGTAVTELQEKLSKNGFYAGKAELTCGVKTVNAICRAQRYYSLIVTGCADEALIRCLTNPAEPSRDIGRTDAEAVTAGKAKFAPVYWYTAAECRAANGSAGVSVSDSDNTLIIIRGTLNNPSASQLSLNWDITASVTMDGAPFSASLRAVTNGGNGYTTTVLPLAQTEFLITCEVPSAAAENAGEAVLTLSSGGETVTFNLK